MADKREPDLIKNFVQEDFLYWLKTRCKYAPAIPIGILASMQPSKSGIERDYSNNPLASAFNAAIMLQKELMGLESFRAFLLVYFKEAATRYYRSVDDPIINVKMQADQLEVTKDTVYDMAHKFVFTSYNMAVANCNLNSKMQTMRLDNDFSFVD